MRRRYSLLSAIYIFTLGAAAGTQKWHTYVNTRYRYSLCYPTGFRAAAEAPNGDGRRFADAGGATMAVFGRNDVESVGLDRTLAYEATDLAGRGGHIGYRAGQGDWRVASGNDARGRIFYAKALRRSDQLALFEIRYPQGTKSRYEAIVTRLSRCFEMLR